MEHQNFLFQNSKSDSFFHFTNDLIFDQKTAFLSPFANHVLWNRSQKSFSFYCDGKIVKLEPRSFCTLTALHQRNFLGNQPRITAISFNREFYCLRDHDHEISCNGILFYGAQEFSILKIPEKESIALETLVDLFQREFSNQDPVQGEMLVSLLKVLIIQLTRIGRNQIIAIQGDPQGIELIRKFNLLVAENFRKRKQVADYAFLLGVSPKKLSDIFRKAHIPPPLQIIHGQVILEAKRLLLFSLKTINQISDELGFEDPSQFSKLFKKMTKESPLQYKNSSQNPGEDGKN